MNRSTMLHTIIPLTKLIAVSQLGTLLYMKAMHTTDTAYPSQTDASAVSKLEQWLPNPILVRSLGYTPFMEL